MKSFLICSVAVLFIIPIISCRAEPEKAETIEDPVDVNETDTRLSLNEILAARRSNRDISSEPLDHETALELLWAGQGITDETNGKRTAPSAFATYYLTLLYCDGTGVYEYDPFSNKMINSTADDIRPGLSAAAFGQKHVAKNGALIVITADMKSAENKFGDNTKRYVYFEAGHVAQNILLGATDMGLGSCPVGGFDIEEATKKLGLTEGHEAIYMIVVGYPE